MQKNLKKNLDKNVKMELKVRGWAVVPTDQFELCFTNAPEMIRGGTIWQVYTNRHDAEEFCKVRFSDASYEIVEVWITTT